MKKIFTLISVALCAMSVNAQAPEEYLAIDDEGNYNAEFKAIVGDDGVTANNVSNGNSVVTFGTANVDVEGVSTGTPADKADPEDPTVNLGQDLTIGASIGDNKYEYTVNSSNVIQWKKGNRGDISYYWIQGAGVPAVNAYAEEIMTDGEHTGKYRLAYESFDPAVGGLPVTGLYYKITTKVDGALRFSIWANKGNHPTYVVDSESKQISDFLVEGYINGQTYNDDDVAAGTATEEQKGKMKWLDNAAIQAIHDASTAKAYVIGAGNQPFFGNLIVDAKAGKTYYFFQGTTQIGFNSYYFAPGKTKEELVTGIEVVKNTATQDMNAPIYNLAGQKVSKNYKGVKVQNGKKFM